MLINEGPDQLQWMLASTCTFMSPIMTNSVERKQYEWKAEAQRSFFNTTSVAGDDDAEHSNEDDRSDSQIIQST